MLERQKAGNHASVGIRIFERPSILAFQLSSLLDSGQLTA